MSHAGLSRATSSSQTEIQPEAPEEAGKSSALGAAPVTPDAQEELRSRFKAFSRGESGPVRLGSGLLPPTRSSLDGRTVSLDLEEGQVPGSLGVLIMEDSGNRYEGQVGSAGMEGLGVLLFEGGGSYAGKWESSAYEGAGIETFADGSHYVGLFHLGKQHGSGVCYYADGTTYAGEWRNGMQQGLGSQDSEQNDGFFYVGNYSNGVRHGLGVAGFSSGEEFSGELENDAPHGYGIAHLGSKKGTYEGQWMTGMRHGWAVSTLSNGSMWAGQWIFGKACWLGLLRVTKDGELPDQYQEAMDLCEEAARLARAAGMSALAQAKTIRIPGGAVQVAIHRATREGVAAAREAHMHRQKAKHFCRSEKVPDS